MGHSPWPWSRSDPRATWTETHYTLRRDLVCEACGHRFGYSFEVDQVSRVHRAWRSTNGRLRRELGRQLRRRIACPQCGARQQEPRRMLLQQGRAQTALSCGLVGIDFLLAAGLALLGGWLAGSAGLIAGLVVALVAVIALWIVALPYLLSIGPSI
jgi:hypothetical protein